MVAYETLIEIFSTNWSFVLLFLFLILFLKWTDWFYFTLKRVLRRNAMYRSIPGPKGLPFIGSALELDKKKPYETFQRWAQEYGNVYLVKIFGTNIVVLSGAETIQEALINRGHDYAGRPTLYYRSKLMSDGSQDIVSASPSPSWHVLRKAVYREMKKYDPGYNRLETLTNLIIDDLIHDFRSQNEKAFDLRDAFFIAILNVTFLFLIGDKLDKNDPKLAQTKKLIEIVTKVMNIGGQGAELDFFPWLRFFGNKAFREIIEAKKLRDEIFQWISEKIKYDLDNGTEINGVIHGFQQLLEEDTENLTTTNVKLTMVNLLIGSTSPTQNYLYLLFHLMTLYPHIQTNLYEEINKVLGKSGRPTLSDQERLPYVRATLTELLRFGSLSPILIPHCTTVDTIAGEYLIPADTTVFMNSRFVHHDPELWKDPYVFHPTRFLNETDGSFVSADHVNRISFLSFGGGPRACPGKVLAMSRMFLVLTNIIQNFRIEPDETRPPSPCDPRNFELGLVLQPLSYTVKLIPRQ